MRFRSRNGSESATISLTGYDLVNSPRWNKGTAFSDVERDLFSLHGLLPPHVGILDEQQARRMQVLDALPTYFQKYSLLRDLQDTNETLFYALLVRHLEQLLPLVYTPTVGEGCQRFSEIWRKPRGLFLSYPNKARMAQILSHPRYDDVRCVVVSDGERILGLGDQGAGGMGIPIGKMALYTAIGGIRPEYCMPILLDVGTDNEDRLKSPIYIGWRHHRVRGAEYDDFVDAFIHSVKQRWPRVLLQWEDFSGANAARLLLKYRDQLCSFNDDIQGTAAVATATVLSAVHVTGRPLAEHRIVIFGFGTAGIGIADLLTKFLEDTGLSTEEARSRIYAVDVCGLLVRDRKDVRPEQLPYARKEEEVCGWRDDNGKIGLLNLIRNAQPTALIGVSGHGGAFSEQVVREMVRHTARPMIFPLSNPTSQSEATAHDLVNWTNGSALIGTGSPFEPIAFNGKRILITQTNNAYMFPGLALGIISARASRVSDGMIKSATEELLRHLPTFNDKDAPLLPSISEARALSRKIAKAVGTRAIQEGLAEISSEAKLETEIIRNFWEPAYARYELVHEVRKEGH